MSYVLVFLAVALADVCWTKYFLEAANKNATKAAAWSAVIVLLGSYTTVEYVGNALLVIPAALGAFAGTYLTVLREKRKAAV